MEGGREGGRQKEKEIKKIGRRKKRKGEERG